MLLVTLFFSFSEDNSKDHGNGSLDNTSSEYVSNLLSSISQSVENLRFILKQQWNN